MKNDFFLILGFLLHSGIALGQTNSVSLKHSEEFIIISNAVEDTFYIQVSLPNNYENSDKIYPVIYLLDSDPSFGMVKGISWWLNFDRLIPEVITVGIAYKKNWWQKRSRDFTPTKNEAKDWGDWPLAGGADKFIDFIVEELNPALEKYRIDWANKSVIGHSFGGLMATYALLTRPEIFDNYISISPALIWNNNYLITLSLDKLQNKKSSTLVYTAIGELDKENIIEPWKVFNEYIEQNTVEKLRWNTKIYANQTHSSVQSVAISDGLRIIFNK